MTRPLIALALLAGFVAVLVLVGLPAWAVIGCVIVWLVTVSIAIGRPRPRRR